jgi:DNA (cytosine-5)-methyltransferase 1
MRPKLLDLYCGAGGAGMGYHRAGFDVVGVDIKPQRRYPFEFIRADALEYLARHWQEFDAIHASPPCQAHSRITPKNARAAHQDMIPDTRSLLVGSGLPYIIENVMGAPLIDPVVLCGAAFGLKVYRHRQFESNKYLMGIHHVPHRDKTPSAGHGLSPKGFVSVTGGGHGISASQLKYASEKGFISVCGHFGGGDYARAAMGIDWMTNAELSQAIPPAYTEYLGRQLIQYV